MCDVSKPFGAPLLVTSIERRAPRRGWRLSADSLAGYFAANPAVGGSLTMYEASARRRRVRSARASR